MVEPMGDWSFMRRPFWLFSHVFAASVVTLFVVLGFWQLDRLGLRQEQNQTILSRSSEPAATLAKVLESPIGDLEYRRVVDGGVYLDDDLARIGSQTQDGSAGDHVVGLVELTDGTQVAVNRGFLPLAAQDQLRPADSGEVEIVAWVRLSQSKDGAFGAADGQAAGRLPRFNLPTIDERSEGELAPVWLQLETSSVADDGRSFPDPVPLPPLSEGSHLSYAVQWFIFALLGIAFYVALVRRIAQRAI